MLRRVLRPWLWAVLWLVAMPVLADRGEWYIEGTLQPGFAWLTHPSLLAEARSSGDDAKSPPPSTSGFAPGGGVSLRYGVTNELHVGAGLLGSGAWSLRTPNVMLGSASGDLYAGTYLELAAPLSASWRFDTGYSFSGLVELQAGPVVAYTGQSALADPNRLDEAGLPMTLPLEIPDVWSLGAMGRAQVLFEARLADGFVLALGPYVGVAFTDGVSVQAGLVLRPAWVTGGWL